MDMNETMYVNSTEQNELKIVPPEGMEIDKENSTFECIKFKPIPKWQRDDVNEIINGYFIGMDSVIRPISVPNMPSNHNVFATEKQAKAALAMAQISQIMANDPRFGGIVTDEEWEDEELKYTINRWTGKPEIIHGNENYHRYAFLAFHTEKQRDLFMKENMDLIKDYYLKA